LTPGYGNLRVDAPTLADAERGTATVLDGLQSNILAVHFHPSEKSSGQPTWARTAPAWMATGGLILAVFCPVPRRRPSARPQPQTRTLVST
jgi:hypothetical protein